jgi:hypothetical protein
MGGCQLRNTPSFLRMAATRFPDNRGQRPGCLVGTSRVGPLFCLFLLVGTIATLDLRVPGIAGRGQTIGQLAKQLLPLIWTGLALVALSGSVIYAGRATMFFPNSVFRATRSADIFTSYLRAGNRGTLHIPRWSEARFLRAFAAFGIEICAPGGTAPEALSPCR